jgi:hypothetical protein
MATNEDRDAQELDAYGGLYLPGNIDIVRYDETQQRVVVVAEAPLVTTFVTLDYDETNYLIDALIDASNDMWAQANGAEQDERSLEVASGALREDYLESVVDAVDDTVAEIVYEFLDATDQWSNIVEFNADRGWSLLMQMDEEEM